VQKLKDRDDKAGKRNKVIRDNKERDHRMGEQRHFKEKPAWFINAAQCPVSGLPIVDAASMTGSNPEIPYCGEMARMGDRIYLLKASGFVTASQMTESLAFAEDFIRRTFDTSSGLVVIEDYSLVKGADIEARKQYFEFFRRRDFFIGGVLYNMKPLLKISFNLARRFHFRNDRVYAVDTYARAVSIALKILEEHPAPARRQTVDRKFDQNAENRLPPGQAIIEDEERDVSKGNILKRYADALLAYIEVIDWEKDGSPAIDPAIAADPYLGKVINAISMIKVEIDTLLQERMAAEKILAESEKMFRHLVEHAHAGIFTYDHPSGTIIRANDAFLSILGRERDAVVGHSPLDFMAPESRALFKERWAALLAGEPISSATEYQFVSKSGQIKWALINTHVTHRNGKADSADVIITDISYLKQIEIELLEYQIKLKGLSIKLSMTEEAQRRELASQLHDRVSQELFVAHLQLAAFEKTLNDPEQIQALAGIKDQIVSVIRETKTLTFDLSPPVLFDLGFAEAVESLAVSTRAKHGLNVQTAFQGEMDQIDVGIKIIYYRNIKELIHNVVKHAAARNIEIRITNSRSSLTAELIDDGAGFDIRDPSGQADLQTGYGLFDIREKISHLGGSINIWSSPGTGTHVRMTIPLS
jgi:PAS domain S-box-containing protein